jgi:hypothetical protein
MTAKGERHSVVSNASFSSVSIGNPLSTQNWSYYLNLKEGGQEGVGAERIATQSGSYSFFSLFLSFVRFCRLPFVFCVYCLILPFVLSGGFETRTLQVSRFFCVFYICNNAKYDILRR